MILSGGVTEAVAVKAGERLVCASSRWAWTPAFVSSELKGKAMPLAHIYIMEGRTVEQKRAVIER